MNLELRKVSKEYAGRRAVDDVSLVVEQGEFLVLIGPSGCGKTTTLKMINRLVAPTRGYILVDDRPVSDYAREDLRRRIGYVIQQVGLFPHMTVAQNVGTVPRLLGWDKQRIRSRTEELLSLVGLDPGEYASAWPARLSGGEAQRVGVARALAADPPVLLMDEPFGAVDPLTREVLQREFAAIQRDLGKTVIFVTHDLDEAIRLGDRIAVMNEGRLVKASAPEELLRDGDPFIRDFTGDDRALKRLARMCVGEAATKESVTPGTKGPETVVAASATLKEALSLMIETGSSVLGVVDATGQVMGRLSMENLLHRGGEITS